MRRLLYLLLLIPLLCTVSCRDSYYVENDLHGMWQVISVERFATGEVTEAQGLLYCMFQRNMVSLCYKQINVPEIMIHYISHFDFVAQDSIGMGYFRKYTTGEGSLVEDEIKIPLNKLNKFGIYQDYTIFRMNQSKQKLVLTSDSACITLRKY